MFSRRLIAGVLAAFFFAAGFCLASEEAVVVEKSDVDEAARAAGEIGREAEEEARRIAREASEFAQDVADSFMEGYDEAKND